MSRGRGYLYERQGYHRSTRRTGLVIRRGTKLTALPCATAAAVISSPHERSVSADRPLTATERIPQRGPSHRRDYHG